MPAVFFVCCVMTPVSRDISVDVFNPIQNATRSYFTLRRGRRRSPAACLFLSKLMYLRCIAAMSQSSVNSDHYVDDCAGGGWCE